MSKPREFWIKKRIGTGGDVLTPEMKNARDSMYREDGYESAPTEDYTHVIEYSAYSELETKLATCLEALNFYADQDNFNIENIHDMEFDSEEFIVEEYQSENSTVAEHGTKARAVLNKLQKHSQTEGG